MRIKHFLDIDTSTFTYVVSDKLTKKCAIIDSVLNFDSSTNKVSTSSIKQVIDYIKENKLSVEWILETHIHADHLTGARYLQRELGGKIAIGEHIKDVLKFWEPLFNAEKKAPANSDSFDHLFKDGEVLLIGLLKVKVIYTPGHTPACISYLIEDSIFVGDTIFMPYVGTSRTDFPGGSASTLYHSIKKILLLPEDTKIYVCHDYPPKNQELGYVTTVTEQNLNNIMVHKDITKKEYTSTRNAKDKNKEVPKLLFPAIELNMAGGYFDDMKEHQVEYTEIPMDKILNA